MFGAQRNIRGLIYDLFSVHINHEEARFVVDVARTDYQSVRIFKAIGADVWAVYVRHRKQVDTPDLTPEEEDLILTMGFMPNPKEERSTKALMKGARIDPKFARGVLANLGKKGLVVFSGKSGNKYVAMTDFGMQIFKRILEEDKKSCNS